jgi:transposase-like protein
VTKKRKILRLLNKGKTVAQIAKQLDVPASYVYSTRWLAKGKVKTKGAKKKKPSKLLLALQETKARMDALKIKDEDVEFVEIKDEDYPLISNVVSPSHYTIGGIETWDFIEAKRLNYNLGSVVKYISRADYKGNDIDDLKKAREFLEREITRREDGKEIW